MRKKTLKSRIKETFYPWKIEVNNPDGKSGAKKLIDFNNDMIPEGAVGFVYMMTYKDSDGSCYSYIGKKNFYSTRKKKFGKKKLNSMTDKRAKKYEIVSKLDYEDYFSSNKELKQAYKDSKIINRTILKICFNKIQLTYQETKHQFKYNVLERDDYLNGNILGKFYKGKI